MGHLFGQDGVRVPSVWEQHGGFYVDLVALAVRSGTLPSRAATRRIELGVE